MKQGKEPSQDYIDYICELYGDHYDDRIEDSRPPAAGEGFRIPGEDWRPGQEADHKSLGVFQKELQGMGIELSSSKIRKVLISGGCWSTERSREVTELFNQYTKDEKAGGRGLKPDAAVRAIASELKVSIAIVSMNLPYQNVVYKLENRSNNAVRCARYKERKKEKR